MARRAQRGTNKLTEAQKAVIVQRLACFESLREVAEALNAEYGVKISPQGVERYDPTKRAGAGMARHLVELFERTRSEFVRNVDAIPEANKAVRIRKLAKASRAYENAGNFAQMAEMLERIAKELGNVHTNRREVTGHAGGPVRMEYSELTDEQLDARIAQLLHTTGLGAGDVSH